MLDSQRVDLSDPAIPESRQPYHAGFATARASGPVLSRLIASVERFGRQSVTGQIRQYGLAAKMFKRPEEDLRGTVAALGRSIAGSWRAEQKAAALAAWLVLAGHVPTSSGH